MGNSTPHVSRRASPVDGPIVATVSAMSTAPAPHADTGLLRAWESRKEAFRVLSSLGNQPEGQDLSAQELACWAVVDEAEKTIRECIAQTSAGVSVQLWTALSHLSGLNHIDDARLDRELQALMRLDHTLDWPLRLVVAALRSLHVMEATNG